MEVTRFESLPPAEVAALWTGRADPAHLSHALLGLAARGHLRVRTVSEGGDDDDVTWELDVMRGSGALQPHEHHLLALVASAPGGRLDALREKETARQAVAAVHSDVVDRGWFRRGRWRRRTGAGRAARAELRSVRHALDRQPLTRDRVAGLLPLALALDLDNLWMARLARERPPPPPWFAPGTTRGTRGWLGVLRFAASVGPPGRDGSGVDWFALVDFASAFDS